MYSKRSLCCIVKDNMKNPKKGFIVPLLIAIIVVLVIGGGFYVYEQNKSQQTSTQDSISFLATSTTQSSITIISPNGGVLTVGQPYTIKWDTKNIGNQSLFIGVMDSNGSCSGSNGLLKEIPGISNSGSYVWTPDSFLAPGNYRIRINTSDNIDSKVPVACGIGNIFSIVSSKLTQVSNVDNSSWRTYTNNQYGFEISYPQDLPAQFCLASYTKNSIGGITTDGNCVAVNKFIPTYNNGSYLNISFSVNPQYRPSDPLGEKLITNTEPYSIGGIDGSLITAGLYLFSHPNDTSFSHVMFQSNAITDNSKEHDFNIELTNFKSSDIVNQTTLLKQILNTLKFAQS